ncbi:MAG: winged helix-turn-helix domain-containing protein [Defluviitaleaceae bacterium]|nr:winged helix-turn-helix domain-containing protein [Defluviitaleaceae bacterium]
MKDIVSIKLDKASDFPLYKQLGEALANLIERGVFAPHTKLPPIRTMSRALRVNNVTVVAAYKYLETNAFAYSVVGSGTYVAQAYVVEADDAAYLTRLVLLEFERKVQGLGAPRA